jgi:hypothetical protein
MFQEFIFIFIFIFILFYSKKIQFPPSPDRAVVHDGSSVGVGGLKCFKNFIYFYLFLFLFSKKFQSPLFPDGAVVHDSSSVGAGGLERNRAANQNLFNLIFFLEIFQSLLKHGTSCRCHPWSRDIRLSSAGRR